MQILYIYTIFDTKANAYLQPFFSLNADTARRDFHKAVNTDGQFNMYAEDYSLHQLGSFDQDDAEFNLLSSPKHIVNAITLRELHYESELNPPSSPRTPEELEHDIAHMRAATALPHPIKEAK